MYRSKFVFIVFLFVSACVPSVSISTPTDVPATPTEILESNPIEPIIWPGLKDGWMVFEASITPQIRDAVYDNKGFVWAASSYGVLRWNIETKEYTQYLTDDGLPGNSITAIVLFQDEVWVGTEAGRIARYQNNKWVIENLDLQSNIISFSDTGDRLWASSRKGLYYYDTNQWRKFERLPSKETESVFQVAKSAYDDSLWFIGGYANEYILYKSNLFDYGGRYVSSYLKYVYRFDGRNWGKFENLTGTSKIIAQPDGSMWFALTNLLVYFNGDNWETIRLPDNQFTYQTLNIFSDESGYIWLKTYQGYYKIRNLTAKELSIEKPLVDIGGIIGFTENGSAIFLAGNYYPESMPKSLGISIFDGKDWQEFSIQEQVAPSEIGNLSKYKPIGFSPKGILYVLSNTELLSFDGTYVNPIYDFGKRSVYSSSVQIYLNDEDVWINGNYLPLTKINSKGIEEFFVNHNFYNFALDTHGKIWLTLKDGDLGTISPPVPENFALTPVEKFKNNMWINQNVNQTINPEYWIEIDNNDTVWEFINTVGFFKFDGENWKRINFAERFYKTEINPFQILDNDNIWTGKNDGYLSHFDGKKWFHHEVEFYARPQNITVLDNGHVWFTLAGRVYFFDGKKMNFVPPEDGLMFDYVEYILLAPDGALWFFANDGVARYKR